MYTKNGLVLANHSPIKYTHTKKYNSIQKKTHKNIISKHSPVINNNNNNIENSIKNI